MVENKNRLEIVLKNGKKCVWDAAEFDDFNYDGKCIIIKLDERLVGIYPVSALLSFVHFG